MSSPENGDRAHDWTPAEPDHLTPESAAGSEASTSADPAAPSPATGDSGLTASPPSWRHDEDRGGRHTSAADLFGGRDSGAHAEPSTPPQPQPIPREPTGPTAARPPAVDDEPTRTLTEEEAAELQRKFGAQRIAIRHDLETRSTGTHHLPQQQGPAAPPAPPRPPAPPPRFGATEPMYPDQRTPGAGQYPRYAAPQPNYPQQYGPSPQPQYGPDQQQHAAAAPHQDTQGGYAGGYTQDPRAQEVNSVAAAGGLTQSFRQERHTTVTKPQPQSGWRHAVLVSTFGLVNPGESKIEREDRERTERVRANVSPTFVFAVVGGRGGASKTTTTAGLGTMFAKCRGGGEAIVLDANPDEGNLASRVNPEARHTFVDVLKDPNIGSRSAVRKYAATSPTSQLDVLASSEDLIDPPVYDPDSLTRTIRTLSNVYNVIGIDCGNDFRSDLVGRILDMATAVVVVSGVQFDSGKAALRVYDYLVNTGRGELVQRSFLMMSERTPATQKALRADIEDTLSPTLWKDPLYVPYDPHLYEASVIDVGQLQRDTVRAYLAGAAKLSDWYGAPPIPLRPVPTDEQIFARQRGSGQ